MITNVPGICLVTSYADCVPLYFVDPVKKGNRAESFRLEEELLERLEKKYCSADAGEILDPNRKICLQQ